MPRTSYRYFIPLITLLLLTPSTSLAHTPQPSTPAQTIAQARQPVPQATIAADLDCSKSPFGKTIPLSIEREPLISFRGGSTQLGLAQLDQLDAPNPSTLERQAAFPAGPPASQLQNVGSISAVALDANNDGETEVSQVFTDSSGALRVATTFPNGSSVVRSAFQTNSTQVVARASTSNGKQNDRILFASRTASGALSLTHIDPIGEVVLGVWRTNQNGRGNPQMLDMAVGDFDGDGYRDDAAIAYVREMGGDVEIIVVAPANVPATGSGANYILNMREIGSTTMNIGTPQSLRMAAGDLDGDRRDEIVYAQEQLTTDSPGVSSGFAIRAFDLVYSTDRTSATFKPLAQLNADAGSAELALATGDTDRDGLDEVVIAYHEFRPEDGMGNGLMVRSYKLGTSVPNTPLLSLTQRALFFSRQNQRNTTESLSLAISDMDKDGLDDVVLAFRDAGNAIQTIRLSDQRGATGTLALRSSLRDGSGGRTGATSISLVMGDWNNDTLKAAYAPSATTTLKCKTIVEPNLTSAVFIPPFWKNIQGSAQRYASIGEARNQNIEEASRITTSRSHSVSAYFGFEVDAEVAKFEARVTAGYEYAASETAGNSTNTGKTISEGWTNNTDSFTVVDNATYNCYNYETRIGNDPVDGTVRFCEYQNTVQEGPTIDAWDVQYGPRNNPEARQWAPIARDWSSLTQFRSAFAVQSDGGTSASRAADGNTNGVFANNSVSITDQGAAPWWQIDLGSSQPVSTIRVWNRTDTNCGATLCPARLSDFHVFVSDTDPRTISDDPNVLKSDGRVQAFFNAGVGGKVTNFQTLTNTFEPIRGRFVRVQLANPGILSLAEVQVFSGNHVEPDSYPVSVRDPDARVDPKTGAFIAGTDGWFLVTRYNPLTRTTEEVRTRGNLLWNGAADGVLLNKVVGPGDGQPTWSLAKDRGTSRMEAQQIDHSVRVGVEFDVAVGAVTKIKAGGGYEFTSGISTEDSRTVSYGSSFEIGGGIAGFPTLLNNKPALWPLQCKYGFQPYTYELTETSNSGYEHRMLVVDYVVPAQPLDRSANLDSCLAGPIPPTQTSLESNFESGAPGSVFVLTAQNFPPDAMSVISIKQPGATAFRNVARVKTDANGNFVFVFATNGSDPVGTYTIRFALDSVQGNASAVRSEGGATTSASVLEVPITITSADTVRSDRPAEVGVPTVRSDAISIQRSLFIPLIRR